MQDTLLSILVPAFTALAGLGGGLLIARHNSKAAAEEASRRREAEKDLALRRLALELTRLELERARTTGQPDSAHSFIAHWAVLTAILKKIDLNLDDPGIADAVRDITSRYRTLCIGNVEVFGAQLDFLATEAVKMGDVQRMARRRVLDAMRDTVAAELDDREALFEGIARRPGKQAGPAGPGAN